MYRIEQKVDECFIIVCRNLLLKSVLHFSSMDSTLYKVLYWIRYYVPLGSIPLAVVCNLLTFIVFSMKSNRESLTSLLYRVLTIAQILSLVVPDGLHSFSMMIANTSLFTYNMATCKVFSFMQIWLRALVAWILNSIALEKLIGVVFSPRSPTLNRKCYYRRLLLGISIFLFVLYGPLLVKIERKEVFLGGDPAPLEDAVCLWGTFNETLTWYSHGIFRWTNMVMASLLPFAILITFNAAVIFSRIASHRSTASSISSDSHPVTSNRQIAFLVSITLTFIVMSLPYPLYSILDYYYFEQLKSGNVVELTELPIDTEILATIGPVCDSARASLTIVFHCLFGKKFRQSLKKVLKRLCCNWR